MLSLQSKLAVPSLALLLLLACTSIKPAPAAATPGEVNPATGLARISVGLKGGLSLTQHQGIDDPRLPYTVDSSWRKGVAAALFLHFPVTDRFGIQQEVVYVQKGSRQTIGVDILDVPASLDVSYELDYLEIPLMTRYVWLRTAGGLDLYSLGGFSFALKLDGRYRLSGFVADETERIDLRADAPMDEVDIFDFALVYATGAEFSLAGRRLLVEYRFSLSLDRLPMPTYAYVPVWDGSELRIDNDPVPLRNQAHAVMLGIRF